MVPGIDPKVDIVFKRLFGTEANADLLIDLLNAVLDFPPDGVVTSVEILNPINEKEALDDKLSILDVKARDAAGRQFNVEMQVAPYNDYPARVLYYLTKLHQQQLHEGEPYDKLVASFSINFLAHVFFRDNPRWHWQFRLRDMEEPTVVFVDHLTIHVIELPKFNRAASDLATGCDRWSYFLRHGAELDTDCLPQPLQTPTIRKAMEELRMLTQNDLEREKYEARLKYQRDEEARRKYYETAEKRAEERGEKRGEERGEKRGEERGEKRGEERGEKRGEERGEKRGEERGVLIGRVQSYQDVLNLEITPEATLREMSQEALQELVSRLKVQVADRS